MPLETRTLCATCAEKCRARSKVNDERKRTGAGLSPEEVAERRGAGLRAALKKCNEVRFSQRTSLENLSATPKHYALRALEEAREAYWRLGDSAFAQWLDERIEQLGGEARPKAAE